MKNKKINVIKLSTILISVVMFISIIVLSCQFIKIANLREKSENLQLHKENLIEQINNYDEANAYYNNNRTEFLENYAREVLGWGQENDIWYTTQSK